MATTTSLPTFSTVSSPMTQSGVTIATSTNSSGNFNASTSAINPDNNSNAPPTSDPFANGPSVYLYGFLATLLLIFLVSIAVAWKGYHTRRLLRARLDEAIARGVYLPGYLGDDYSTFGRGAHSRLQQLQTPIMYHNWLDTTLGDDNDLLVATGWDIKPTAIAAIRPHAPPPVPNVPPSRRTSLLREFLESFREYWFARAPVDTSPGQPDSRPRAPPTTTTGNDSEKEVDLSNALGMSITVLIAMPNAANPTSHRRGVNWKGKSVSRPNSSFSAVSHSVTTHIPAQGVASTSSPRQSVTAGVVEEVHEKEDLPEMIMGVAEVALERPAEPSFLEENQEGVEAKMKSTPTPSERIQSTSTPR